MAQGGTLTYNITYSNRGYIGSEYNVYNTMLIDTLPPEVNYVSSSDGGVYDSTNHTVIWDIGTVEYDSLFMRVSVNVTVDPSTTIGTYLVNFAVIDGDGSMPAVAFDADTVVGAEGDEEVPLLQLYKTDDVTTVAQGGTLTYNITYSNRGYIGSEYNVYNTMLIDTLPPEVNYVSSSDGGVYDSTNHTVIWDIGTVEYDSLFMHVSVNVTVNPSTTVGTYLVNFAVIDGDGSMPVVVFDADTVVVGGEVPNPQNPIPEFPTIALPVIAVLGLALFFQRRKD
ncbi:PEF-CTERM sorting domain-containing protein [Methanolobus sediminis]|uniref:PEF-CTERM sorting domain-containing protein n=1 Tax=Methanolobus sediminis TaxID=3072978 RepID=A0AA51YLC5_9EURY|nr:PEF-CTERM sorting domain-containing protein [Methanolobus sediminis]WMW24839.1 PEF-CTERM sorting domain-containing protein [Methanolobus sediminis]